LAVVKVLVLENFAAGPVGLFGDYLERRRGARLRVATPETMPEQPGDEDLLVVLGSPTGVYEELPWIVRQRALVRQAIEAGRPVVGICFGAQLIASAIGGTVAPMGRRFCGWIASAEVVDPVWRGPWARWHGDHLTLPEDAEVLARDQGTIQAFQYRQAVGVQFHPEANEAILTDWSHATPDQLTENGLTFEQVIADTRANVHGRAAAREALFDEMLRRCMAPVAARPLLNIAS
jgi:GMP synthase (glutamine-hydrolysing)